MKDKKQLVEDLYQRFKKYTETAEQHEFVTLYVFDKKLTAGYNDLITNWNEEHADIYIRSINKLLEKLGA